MNESPISIGSEPSSKLDELSDEELDTLPYGVIALDREGIIRQYNLAEARFARLDRNDVLHKPFFGQIAPCTNTPEFRGRFEELAREGNTVRSVRFPYVFDFRFGAQQVEIEIVRGRAPNRFYLCINRRKLMPPRREVPSAQLAPLQRELAPSEERVGVQRDAVERRVVQVGPSFFDALVATEERSGPTAHAFVETWGFQWGRRAAVELEAEVLESFDKVLRELPMVTVAEVVAQHLRRHGLGQLTVDFAPSRLGVFLLHLERSALAETTATARVAEGPRCTLLAGWFRALFGHLAHKALVVREAECRALGAPRCTFVVGSQERAEAIERAVLDGNGVASVLRRLEG